MSETSASSKAFDPNAPIIKKRLSIINAPLKMKLYYLQRLPSVSWWGIRVLSCTPHKTSIKLPYGWRSQNPFKSIYFAAQLGAAELSTGLMALLAITDRGAPISMLVTNIEAEFVKKADSDTVFNCDEGQKIIEVVQAAIDSGEGQEVSILSTGVKADGQVVSRVRITWSFRVKQKK